MQKWVRIHQLDTMMPRWTSAELFRSRRTSASARTMTAFQRSASRNHSDILCSNFMLSPPISPLVKQIIGRRLASATLFAVCRYEAGIRTLLSPLNDPKRHRLDDSRNVSLFQKRHTEENSKSCLMPHVCVPWQ